MEEKLKGPIEAIFFDLGWTLVYPSTGHWLYADAALPFLGEGEVRTAIFRETEKHWYAVMNEGHLWLSLAQEWNAFREAYRRTSVSLGLGWTDEILDAIADDQVYSDRFYHVYDGVHAMLARLSKRYKLGIISDTVPSVSERLHKLGLLPYFTSVTLSCYVDARKPDLRIFENALLNTGVPGDRAVFVDDLAPNLDAIGTLGVQGVQICAGPHVVPSDKHFTIQNICDLEALLP